MSALISKAMVLAEELHRDHRRKGSQVPYLSHLLAVSSLVMEDGGGEEAAAAALLHDAAEDQGGVATVERIRGVCGGVVAGLVVECSDSLGSVGEAKAPWRQRKQAALDALPSHSHDALLIIAADKLHNARATLVDLQLLGPEVWARFKTGRDGFVWYHEEMAERLAALLPGSRSVALLEKVNADLAAECSATASPRVRANGEETGGAFADDEVAVLHGAVSRLLADGWVKWPGGYPDDLELALIDAVFSIRARYGSRSDNSGHHTGVIAVVERWREFRGDQPWHLGRLADIDPVDLADILRNATLTSGRTKGSAAREAAVNLVEAGILSVDDLRRNREVAQQAYCQVHGLSWVTFSYFCMLLGVPDVKADTWITAFVRETLGREVTSKNASDLMHRLAGRLNDYDDSTLPKTPTELDHAVWNAMRAKKKPLGQKRSRQE